MKNKYERLGQHEGIFGVPGSGLGIVLVEQLDQLKSHEDVRVVVLDLHEDGVKSTEYYGFDIQLVDIKPPYVLDWNEIEGCYSKNNILFIKSTGTEDVCTSEFLNAAVMIAAKNQEKGYKTVVFVKNCFLEEEIQSRYLSSFLNNLIAAGGSATIMGSLADMPEMKHLAKYISCCILLHQSSFSHNLLRQTFKIPKWNLKDVQYADPGTGFVWYRNKKKTVLEPYAVDDDWYNSLPKMKGV